MLESVREYGCETLSIGKPTYWPTDPSRIPDLIDFFIIKNISTNFLHIEEGWDMDSDHSPVMLTLSECIIKKESNPTLVNKFTDWSGFRLYLDEKINLSVPLKNEQQIDIEAELYINNIQQAAWKNTPEIKRRLTGNNYLKEIRDLIQEKTKLRRKWQQTRAPQDKTKLNNSCQRLRREIQIVKNESISAYLRQLTADSSTDYSLWRATKGLKRPTMQIPPVRQENGKWARNNEQKADSFANYLEKIFQPNEVQESESDWNKAIQEEEGDIEPVTPKEVKDEITKNINPKKAPGFDLITGEVLRQFPEKVVIKLTNLIDATFRLKYVPRLWKIAEVIMLSKPGKPPHEVSSYMPISLLPVISKLFEKLLLKRMKPIIEIKKLIPSHLIGFRNSHSTIDQVHRITNKIEKALEEKRVCSTIFLDVAQAFDKVWHEGLNHKLKTLLPKQFSEILRLYLAERHFRIKQEGAYLNLKEIKAGVPQGSVLGPILYLLYTSDIPTLKNNTIATFADDTAILAVGESNQKATEKLQAAVDQITGQRDGESN